MATVETLGKLQRRMTITLPVSEVQAEVEKRLKIRARTAKAPGFRPGKVPMKMVAAQFGYQVETEVLNDKVGSAFDAAIRENDLRVAGFPNIQPKADAGATQGTLAFDAMFEVYPEVKVGDLNGVDVEKTLVKISDAEVDKTIEILRQQRVHYHVKGEQSAHGDGGSDLSAQNNDRVTIDFVGTIDGVEFVGGKAEDYTFVLGQGRMLPEFEAAALGLKAGESKTFPLAFPEDYHGKDVAGKTAEFKITMKKVEWPHLPPVDAEFAKSLGIADGDLNKMREDIRTNLDREVNGRARAKTKESVMDALIKVSELDVPQVLVQQEVQRLAENTRNDMAQRGMNVKDMNFPLELFAPQAERRVRLGLILQAIVEEQKLHPTPEQIKTQVEEFAQAYEDPKQVVKYYYADRRRLAEVEALVFEENVVNYVLGKAKVKENFLGFDELMGNAAQA
jgi:trigger factor